MLGIGSVMGYSVVLWCQDKGGGRVMGIIREHHNYCAPVLSGALRKWLLIVVMSGNHILRLA